MRGLKKIHRHRTTNRFRAECRLRVEPLEERKLLDAALLAELGAAAQEYQDQVLVDDAQGGRLDPAAAVSQPAQAANSASAAGSIRGTRFNDFDQDGVFEPDDGETGLAGWTMFLDLNENGYFDFSEPTTETDAAGEYNFAGLVAGDYRVHGVVEPGWEQTAPQLAGGQTLGEILWSPDAPLSFAPRASRIIQVGNRLVVGAEAESVEGQSRAGAVYVYDLKSGTLEHRLMMPQAAANANFGRVVVQVGSQVLIAAYGSSQRPAQGFVFDLDTGALDRTIPLPASSPTSSITIKADGDELFVGAPNYDRNGAILQIDPETGDILQTYASPSSSSASNFGNEFFVFENTILVPLFTNFSGQGSLAWLFDRETGEVMETLSGLKYTTAIGDHFAAYRNAGDLVIFDAADATVVHDISNPDQSSRIPFRLVPSNYGLVVPTETGGLLVDPVSGEVTTTFHLPDPITLDVDFTPDAAIVGDMLLLTSVSDAGGLPYRSAAQLFSLSTGEWQQSVTLDMHFSNADYGDTRISQISYLGGFALADGFAAFGVFGFQTFSLWLTSNPGTEVSVAEESEAAGINFGAVDVSDPPLARDDLLTVAEDSLSVPIDVLANDTAEPDVGESLRIISVESITQGAQVEIVPGGSSLLYTPSANFFGTEQFLYTIEDSDGETNVARVTVTVTPTNDDPVGVDDEFHVTGAGAVSFDVLKNDRWAPDGQETLTIESVTSGDHGGSIEISTDRRTIQYAPADGFFGSETFSYVVQDEAGGRATAYVVVRVHEQASGSISGTLWNDVDHDQVHDANESALAGWTVYLDDNNNRQLDENEPRQTTADDGSYTFTNVAPGRHAVAEILPENWKQTSPYYGGGDVGSVWRTLQKTGPQPQSQTTAELAAAGDKIYVTLSGNDPGAQGALYEFDLFDSEAAARPFLRPPTSDFFGSTVIATGGYLAVSGGDAVYILDPATGNILQTLATPLVFQADSITKPSFVPLAAVDDDRVLIGDANSYGSVMRGRVYVYDAQSGELQHSLVGNHPDQYYPQTVAGAVNDGVLVSPIDDFATLYDATAGTPILSYPTELSPVAFFGAGYDPNQTDFNWIGVDGVGTYQLVDGATGIVIGSYSHPVSSATHHRSIAVVPLAGGQYLLMRANARTELPDETDQFFILDAFSGNLLATFSNGVHAHVFAQVAAVGADVLIGSYGGASDPGSAAGYLFSGVAAANIVSVGPGESVTNADFGNFSLAPAFPVEVTPRGVSIQLPSDIDVSLLNLYDGLDAAADAADLTLVGAATGPVRGSVLWSAETSTLEFLTTAGPLVPDSYTLTVRSAPDSLLQADGGMIDGDADLIPGGDFVFRFAVEPTVERTVSISDFVRGPRQPIDWHGSGGIPIAIDDADGVTQISIAIAYDSSLLDLADVELANDMPDDWSIDRLDLSTPGVIEVEASGGALSGGSRDLFKIVALVAPNASIGDSQLLRVTEIALNGGALAARGADGLQIVAYPGDVTGNEEYAAFDAAQIARVTVGLDSGFDAFDRFDPLLLADVSGNGTISSLDASFVARKAVGFEQTSIPDIPPQPAPGMASAESIADNRSESQPDRSLTLDVIGAPLPANSARSLDSEPLAIDSAASGLYVSAPGEQPIATANARQTETIVADDREAEANSTAIDDLFAEIGTDDWRSEL